MSQKPSGLTYADAGVSIDAGNRLVDRIKPAAANTRRRGTMDGLGGFGAMFDLRAAGFQDPILVSATDGVGTKLRVAIDSGRLGTIGIDLVAMCVNDLICQGAEPLFFLDYYATGRLDVDAATEVVNGIAEGCRMAGAALIGGETAEMPGLYHGADFDLAGFAVGAMERGTQLPAPVSEGDLLFGLRSSGVHSNGYSLVRRVVENAGLDWDAPCPFAEGTLGEALLEPTRIYVSALSGAVRDGSVRALAHITGGGLTENLPRVVQNGMGLEIDLDAWDLPPVFNWLRNCASDSSGIADEEMLKTFNCGIGMVAIVSPGASEAFIESLRSRGEDVVQIGRVTVGNGVSYKGRL